jgi:hypothetical protein
LIIIAVDIWGAKIEAITGALSILPGHANLFPVAAIDPRTARYELQPRSVDGHSEVLLLRHGDVISSAKSAGTLTCRYAPEVQVTSSAVEVQAVGAADATDGVAEAPEEDTEDENQDLDTTITDVKATQGKSQQPQATPQLSYQRSIVIQETPTVVRIDGTTDYSALPELDMEVDCSTSPEPNNPVDAAPYSTARTVQSQNDAIKDDIEMSGSEPTDPQPIDISSHTLEALSDDTPQRSRHPRVVVSKKRLSPAADGEESDAEPLSRSSKRARHIEPSDNDSQDSRLSNIVVDLPASKNRKKLSEVKIIDESIEVTPPQSQRSSQRSGTATSELYEGDPPCVATSNSSLVAKSQAVKFLKKQGGSFIESIKETFNVLCVRDGDLHKTSKVLYAIAIGTPIVTDKWLLDSAKAGHFLSIDAYKPSAPKQEKEWRFFLLDVLGRPHTPFGGYTVHFTTTLVAAYTTFNEIEQVCKAAGAVKVTKKKIDKSENVIVLAAEEGDREAEKLMEDGVTCYNRDLLPISIFRGTLDLDSDEFKIGAGGVTISATKETKKKRGRKSAG